MNRQTTRISEPKAAANAGFSLLYVIAVIMALSTLLAGIVSLTSTGLFTEVNQSFTTRARYVALAGFSYARQFKEDYSDLDAKTVTLSNNDKFAFSNYRQFQDASGNIRIELKVTGTAAVGTPQESNYVIFDNFLSEDQGAITFGKNFPDFSPITSDPTKSPVVKNANYTFTIGNNQNFAFGAFYYTGTKSLNWGYNNCTNGLCQFQDGVRLFFVSKYDANAADGIVFTLFNSDNNTTGSMGGDSDKGEMIGYAGDSRVWNGNAIDRFIAPNRSGIRPPKLGIEFDNYPNTNFGNICAATDATQKPRTGYRQDDANDHIAYVYWGDDNDLGTTFGSGFDCAYCASITEAQTNMTNSNRAFSYIDPRPAINPRTKNESASRAGNTAYIGKDFGASGKIITGFRAYGSSDKGFSDNGTAATPITISLFGSNSNDYASATAIAAAAATADANSKVITLGDVAAGQSILANSTSYRYYWLKIQGLADLYVSHVQFLETLSNIYNNTTDYPNNTTQVPANVPYVSANTGPNPPNTSSNVGKATWEGAMTYDDNKHGVGENVAANTSATIPQNGYWKTTGWNTTVAFAFRAEIERSLTPVASGGNAGKYAYRMISWFRPCVGTTCLEYVNSTGSTSAETDRAYFSDTSRFLCANHADADYAYCTVDNIPVLDRTIYLTATQHSQFNRMVFGFTEATGGSTQTATYSYFALQFMKPNDYDTTVTPAVKRRVINRVIQ